MGAGVGDRRPVDRRSAHQAQAIIAQIQRDRHRARRTRSRPTTARRPARPDRRRARRRTRRHLGIAKASLGDRRSCTSPSGCGRSTSTATPAAWSRSCSARGASTTCSTGSTWRRRVGGQDAKVLAEVKRVPQRGRRRGVPSSQTTARSQAQTRRRARRPGSGRSRASSPSGSGSSRRSRTRSRRCERPSGAGRRGSRRRPAQARGAQAPARRSPQRSRRSSSPSGVARSRRTRAAIASSRRRQPTVRRRGDRDRDAVPRRPVRLGRGEPVGLRLLGLVAYVYAQLGVSLPAQRGDAVRHRRRLRLARRAAAGRPRLLQRARAHGDVHRRRPVHPRAAHRRRRQDLEHERGLLRLRLRRRQRVT